MNSAYSAFLVPFCLVWLFFCLFGWGLFVCCFGGFVCFVGFVFRRGLLVQFSYLSFISHFSVVLFFF